MKRISYIILFAVAFLLVACTKRPELKVYKLEFVTETVEKTNSTAKMTVEYSYPTELESVKVILSENSDLGGAVSKEASITEKTFVAEFNDLKQGTKYHYCYEYSNGISLLKTDVKSFETDDIEVALPSVNTVEVKEVMSMSAVAVGNVSSDGGSVITSRGFCWSKTANPTVQDYHVEVNGTTGAFEGSLTGLEANTKYHVRAYAVNSKGTGYGEDMTFTTTQGLPVVVTSSVTEITATSAKCGGNVTDQGASDVTERGICWSTDNNPTVNDDHVSSGSGTGTYTCFMTDLMPEEIYYVRAYAKNAQGISYGDEVNFTALEGLPTVTTSVVANITSTTATCGGNVTNQGASNVTERGVCWSTSQNPTVSNSHTTDGSGTGSFTSNITGLTPNTTYYVRAYAINSKGTSYGEQKSFTTYYIDDHAYVDLDLPSGLLWATCNVGADSPEDYGWYFMWGSVTEGGDPDCRWANCPGNGGSIDYNSSAIAAWDATHLTNGVLNPDVDAAHANWGDGWRMPTKDDLQELYDNTSRTWTAENGVNGWKFASKTDATKYIFLPAAGYREGTSLSYAGSFGYYWSSSLDSSNPDDAYGMDFSSGIVLQRDGTRYYGRSVRPVRPAR